MLETGQSSPPVAPGSVPVKELYTRTDLSRLAFDTTSTLDSAPDIVGQDRARRALSIGTKARAPGFNMFVIGSDAAWMRQSVEICLRGEARSMPAPADWVYVNNFALPHKPLAIELPPGRAGEFRDRMHELVQDLKIALPAAFESSEYQGHRDIIEETARHGQENAFAELREKAEARNLAILRTPMGFGLVPVRNGKVLPPDEFSVLPEADRKAIETTMREFEPQLEQTIRTLPRLEKDHRDAIRDLDRRTARSAVGQSIDEAKRHFQDIPRILEHLETIRADLADNVALFIMPQPEGEVEAARSRPGGPFDRYEVNVLVSEADRGSGAPVIEEQHPTLGNLTGRVEHLAQQGVLVTNFRLIKPGVLHRANGGFLLLDARNLLSEPYSWAALKRSLARREIVIEDLAHALGFSSTVSLEPDPIPLDLKVVLFGDRRLYYLLCSIDPEVAQHFKILADFDDDIARDAAAEEAMARSIASLARNEKLRAIERAGVERLLEHAARVAGDRQKLTLVSDVLRDLLVEADFWAGESGRASIGKADVERAIDEQINRANRVEQRHREATRRRVSLIDTQGWREGQINGLSVIGLGGHAFGAPSRITCRVRPGSGKIVDIEREVELGGPIHSKGVLVVTGFLAGRYAMETPMSLFASIVFEQSYGGVEGDSASAAELCALLSAIAETPLRQDCAMTGSINQHGEIQAIGGVNEKIEGFFDVCNERGLTGTQRVLIPVSNVQHLMLRADVVAACEAGRFGVHAIATIDDAIEILTGLGAGARGAEGTYPDGSFNKRVEDRLVAFAKARAGARDGKAES